MVFEQYFVPFDTEVIQHSHEVDGNEVLESTVHGFGPSLDLSILRVASSIQSECHEVFLKAISGKLSILGCQFCCDRKEGRWQHILRTIPVNLVRIVFDNTTCDEVCQDRCGSNSMFRDHLIGFRSPTAVDLGRFPFLKEFCVGVLQHLSCDNEMDQQYSQLCSMRGKAENDYEQFSDEDAITVRKMTLPVLTARNYALMLDERWAEPVRIFSEDARLQHKVPSHAQVVMEFYEEQSERWTTSFFYNVGFESYLVGLRLPVAAQSSDSLLTKYHCRFGALSSTTMD